MLVWENTTTNTPLNEEVAQQNRHRTLTSKIAMADAYAAHMKQIAARISS